MSLNKVAASGNLGADAALRMAKSGTPVLTFSVAVAERVQQADGIWVDYANWLDCVMFGKRAEALGPWLKKGDKVALIGRIHTSTYEVDGRRCKKWEVRVDDIELMQRRREGQREAQAPPAAPEPPVDVYDEDIPF